MMEYPRRSLRKKGLKNVQYENIKIKASHEESSESDICYLTTGKKPSSDSKKNIPYTSSSKNDEELKIFKDNAEESEVIFNTSANVKLENFEKIQISPEKNVVLIKKENDYSDLKIQENDVIPRDSVEIVSEGGESDFEIIEIPFKKSISNISSENDKSCLNTKMEPAVDSETTVTGISLSSKECKILKHVEESKGIIKTLANKKDKFSKVCDSVEKNVLASDIAASGSLVKKENDCYNSIIPKIENEGDPGYSVENKSGCRKIEITEEKNVPGKNENKYKAVAATKISDVIPNVHCITEDDEYIPKDASNYILNQEEKFSEENCNEKKELSTNDLKLYATAKDEEGNKQKETVQIGLSSDIDKGKFEAVQIGTVLQKAEHKITKLVVNTPKKKKITPPSSKRSKLSFRKMQEKNGSEIKKSKISKMAFNESKEDSNESKEWELQSSSKKLDSETENTLKSELYGNEGRKFFSSSNALSICCENAAFEDIKPLNARYDLAIERNRRRFRTMQRQGELDNCMTIEERKREIASKSEEAKIRDAEEEDRQNRALAYDIAKITLKILQTLQDDPPNQFKIVKYLERFLHMSVTPGSLIYVPHFIHAVSFCRGCKYFVRTLRSMANDCYNACHAMFPVPLGSNFETVYMSEVRKLAPDIYDPMEDFNFDYGDLSSDSSDGD